MDKNGAFVRRAVVIKPVDVAIVGGGLAGVYLAYRLQQKNVPYVLLEAKSELGGRIHSVNSLDLGPTWFWPHQQRMQALLCELSLLWFEQYAVGDVLYQMSTAELPQRSVGASALLSYRVVGGMMALICALQRSLSPQSVYLSCPVTRLQKNKEAWLLGSGDQQFSAKQVVFAAPPRLLLSRLPLSDFLSADCVKSLSSTPTWMAAQAKFVAVYPSAFWRKEGLAGDVFSRVGPMIELHDACADDESVCALFGFLGLSVAQRKALGGQTLEYLCVQQLVDVFGEKAAKPSRCYVQDWSQDRWVCTAEDVTESPRHPSIHLRTCQQELASKKINFVGSEYAETEAGYLEGALASVDSYCEREF